MKKVFIKDKLKELGYSIDDIVLGDFDAIGEVTAKKTRNRDNPLFKTAGCYFRPNYERGILLYHLIKRFEAKRVLIAGFGRGYASFCAAKAMCDTGALNGKVFSIDVNVDENHLKNLAQLFPREWFEKLFLMKSDIWSAIPQLGDEKMDIILIEASQDARAVWEAVKNQFSKLAIFDDYHLQPEHPVSSLVDTIDADRELIMMDRRIFHDDRNVPDDELAYGQAIIKGSSFDPSSYILEW